MSVPVPWPIRKHPLSSDDYLSQGRCSCGGYLTIRLEMGRDHALIQGSWDMRGNSEKGARVNL